MHWNSSPLFLRSLAYKGVCFPFRTQGHEIIHAGDLKATQRGRNSSTKLACVPLNGLASMQGPTRIPTHSHANARAHQQGEREKDREKKQRSYIRSLARLVSVSVVWQWESWHHPAPFPPLSSAATAELFCLRAEWAHWMLGDFCLSFSLSPPVSLQLVHVVHRSVVLNRQGIARSLQNWGVCVWGGKPNFQQETADRVKCQCGTVVPGQKKLNWTWKNFPNTSKCWKEGKLSLFKPGTFFFFGWRCHM